MDLMNIDSISNPLGTSVVYYLLNSLSYLANEIYLF